MKMITFILFIFSFHSFAADLPDYDLKKEKLKTKPKTIKQTVSVNR